MTSSHDAWTPVFKMWPTFELTQPNIAPEKITPAEFKRRVEAATRQHEANLVSMAQAWVAQGRLQFAWGWWVVHGGMACILAVLFWQRMRVGSVLRR